jgi:hypothetical protein
VEISENSENHLKAIVGGREVAGWLGLVNEAENAVKRTQGEGKAGGIVALFPVLLQAKLFDRGCSRSA